MNIQTNTLLLGLQFGDEGKGKIAASLVKNYDVIVRFNGGSYTKHIVYKDNNEIVLHQVPSGVLHKKQISVIAKGVTLNILTLSEELHSLQKHQVTIDPSHFFISSLCPVIMPWHVSLDMAAYGSNTGLISAAAARVSKQGFRLADLFIEDFPERFMKEAQIQNKIIAIYKGEQIDIDAELKKMMRAFNNIKEYMTDTYSLLREYTQKGKSILFESAQGIMCDTFNGTYPYVCTSVCEPSSIVQSIGFPVKTQNIGIFKPYLTCVDKCSMPTEIWNSAIKEDEKDGGKRIGWIDIPMLKYALGFGIDELALMKLDVLTGTDEIQICTKYMDVHNDCECEYIPSDNASLGTLTACYESLPSWKENLQGIKTFEKLPQNAQDFVKRLEEILGKKITYISTGSMLEDLVVR